MILEHYQIPTAPFALIKSLHESSASKIENPAQAAIQASPHRLALQTFPVFVKPAADGSSKGITPASKVRRAEDLESTVADVRRKWSDQDVLIETFLPGREFTVGMLGTGERARVIGLTEMGYDNLTKRPTDDFYCYERKSAGPEWWVNYTYHDFRLGGPVIHEVGELALATYRILGLRDVGRIDIRMDDLGKPHVIEVSNDDSY